MDYSSISCDELVKACAELGNKDAWEEFVRRFKELIGSVVWRIACRYGEKNRSLVTDLVQETFAKICDNNCRLLREFKPHHEGAFFGILTVTASSVAHDYFRARNSEKRGAGKVDLALADVEVFVTAISSGPDPMQRRILLREIDEALRSICPEKHREIFWLYYRQGLTANDIAMLGSYGLTAKGIESILHRLRLELRTKLADRRISALEGIQKENTLSQGEGQL